MLAADCMAHWQAGRQRCEELSLTGNNCTHRRHTVPGASSTDTQPGSGDKRALPSLQCCSGVQYIAACNCGRRQANREDPYKLVDANYNFYQLLEEECCKDLERVEFPVYVPTKVNLVPTEKIKLENIENKEKTSDLPDIVFEDTSEEDKERDEVEHVERVDTPAEDDAEIILEIMENLHVDGKSPNKVSSLLSRNSSQAEFLTHMKTLGSGPGLRPEFPSWSLVMLGSSHVYSHSSGLGAQPGFMSSSKFLLPWEIPLTKISAEELADKWPNIVENAAKRASLRGAEEPVDTNKVTVKVFVGFEYECPRGHRFMVSAPDKPMKSSSTVREAASKLASSDLPLYMACPCRITKPPVAQLTRSVPLQILFVNDCHSRLHIVTPKAPLWLTVLPQVQPSPGGPVFVTGNIITS